MALTLPSDYVWVVFVMVLQVLQYFVLSERVGRVRRRVFSKEFFEQNAQHFPELKDLKPDGGYPDMGHGRFADRLPFNDWWDFGNIQRVHYHALESMPVQMTLMATAGLFNPKLTFIFGVFIIVGRLLFSVGYVTKGSKGRGVGAGIGAIGLLGTLITVFYGIWTVGGGVGGFLAFLKSLPTAFGA